MIFNDLQLASWFFLPAAIANMTPILLTKTPILRDWGAPLDCNLRWHGKRLFGANKTWRGLIVGIIMATIALWLQQVTVQHYHWAAVLAGPVSYATLPTIVLGPLFGLGALGADASKSFLKRQRGILPGRSWIPVDQTDYIVGAIILTLPIVQLSLPVYLWAVLLWPSASLASSFIGYLAKLKKRPI